MVPTLDVVNGLAIHGPNATLFTLGRHHTVQQFELNPPTLVANRQHIPPVPPPSPPVSTESRRGATATAAAEVGPVTAVPVNASPAVTSPQPPPHMSQSLAPVQDHGREMTTSPLRRIAEEMDQIEERRQERSAAGSTTSSNTRSSRSSTGRRHARSPKPGPSFQPVSEGTQFSQGSSFHAGRASVSTKLSTTSLASSQTSGVARSSRLRQEVLRSPDQPDKVVDLFPLARERLSDVPYKNPVPATSANRTAADLRRQLLSVVFGWHDDIEALIDEERRCSNPLSSGAQVAGVISLFRRRRKTHSLTLLSDPDSPRTSTGLTGLGAPLQVAQQRQRRSVSVHVRVQRHELVRLDAPGPQLHGRQIIDQEDCPGPCAETAREEGRTRRRHHLARARRAQRRRRGVLFTPSLHVRSHPVS